MRKESKSCSRVVAEDQMKTKRHVACAQANADQIRKIGAQNLSDPPTNPPSALHNFSHLKHLLSQTTKNGNLAFFEQLKTRHIYLSHSISGHAGHPHLLYRIAA